MTEPSKITNRKITFAHNQSTKHVHCTVYCSIVEQFKYDDEVKISTETEEVDVIEEVHHISENRTNFDREFLGS